MRTFHIGGAASSSVEQSSSIAPVKGVVKLENVKSIKDKFNNNIVLSRNAKIKIFVEKDEKFSSNIPFGSRLLFSDGDEVKANQILAEWDPYTLPIISEKNGFAKYIDLKQGISFREAVDDTTGIGSKVVIDWSQNQKSKNFKPAINILDGLENNDDDKIENITNYPMSIDTMLSIEDGQEVYAGQVLARIPKDLLKQKILQEDFHELLNYLTRKPKDPAIMCEIDGKISFGKDFKNKRRVVITSIDENNTFEILIRDQNI